MNCRPDDLACVVRVPQCDPVLEAALREQLVGKFVRVVALVPATVETWQILEPIVIQIPLGGMLVKVQLTGLEDFLLQPVRGVPVHDEQLDEVPA